MLHICNGVFIYPGWRLPVQYDPTQEEEREEKLVLFVAGTWFVDDCRFAVPSCAFILVMWPDSSRPLIPHMFVSIYLLAHFYFFLDGNYVLEMSRLISWSERVACREGMECQDWNADVRLHWVNRSAISSRPGGKNTLSRVERREIPLLLTCLLLRSSGRWKRVKEAARKTRSRCLVKTLTRFKKKIIIKREGRARGSLKL